jgi:hypothetical protein
MGTTDFNTGGFWYRENETEEGKVGEGLPVETGRVSRDEIPDDLGEPAEKRKQETGNFQQQDRDAAFPEVFTAAQLEKEEYPPLEWIIQDILPQGVTLLAGPPKSGKTRMMTHIAVAKATGSKALEKIDVKPSGVLFLCLEDSERRVKERLAGLLPGGWPRNLHLVTEWPRMDSGGLSKLDEFLDLYPRVRLVVIDVLERFRGPRPYGTSIYQYDYQTIVRIKAVADKHDVGIVLVHHTNKLQDALDVFTRISGTQGLTGAADTIMLLEREDRMEAEATLSIDGREVEAQELGLEYDLDTGAWRLLGDANLYLTSDSRREIISYLTQHPRKTPKEVSKAIDKNYSTTKSNMRNMAFDGQLVRDQKGRYSVAQR